MKHLLLSATLLMGAFAFAGELDGDTANSRGLQGTVVVRVDHRTNKAAILKSDARLSSAQQAQALAKGGKFQAVSAANTRTELDNDGGSSSWYWYYNTGYGYGGYPYGGGYNPGYGYNYGYYNSNYLYWYGQSYNPYYSYYYGGYSYYYYGSYSGRWW